MDVSAAVNISHARTESLRQIFLYGRLSERVCHTSDTMAEWLRRQVTNPEIAGSNPVGDKNYSCSDTHI